MSNGEQTVCPVCRQSIRSDAVKCEHCRELLRDYKECPKCYERVRLQAKVCRYCKHDFPEPAPPLESAALTGILRADGLSPVAAPRREEIDYTIAARPEGGFFCGYSPTALMAPSRMRVTSTEISIRTWDMLGLRSFGNTIPISRVSSVRLMLGIFWATIVVETFGGTGDYELCGLNKREASDMVEIIERYVLQTASANGQTPRRLPDAYTSS